MGSRDHCCLCGATRRPTQQPVESFGNNTAMLNMAHHRPMLPDRWEKEPQLLVSVSMWRNGGIAKRDTHMCDDCIVVGLLEVKRFVDESLKALDPDALARVQGGAA
ncbi:TPA: hypothetical protein UL921_002385 [Stenotrophomonas maltophilia]|nr:hypothetical protein [Stenotrophomonas maltophilia]